MNPSNQTYFLSCIGSRRIFSCEAMHDFNWGSEKAFARICERLSQLRQQHPNVVMYNSLAIGADDLFFRAARQVGVPVIGILPMSVEEYVLDFADGAKRDAFYQRVEECDKICVVSNAPRPTCYAEAADYMLAHSHELWAITDGSQGATGGTLETLQKSKQYEYLRGRVFVVDSSLNFEPFEERM